METHELKRLEDAVIEDFVIRLTKIAYALREDGRTADGCSKAAAANNLDKLASDVRLYFASDRPDGESKAEGR